MQIVYKTSICATTQQIIDLYEKAGLPRPTTNPERIAKMYSNASLIISAWQGEELVGIARSLTDFCWCCYLADLAVDPGYQKHGIGKKLIELTGESITDESMLLLLSVPTAMAYYPKIGMEAVDNGFIIYRKK